MPQNDWKPIYTKTSGQAPLTVGFYFKPDDSSFKVEWKQFSNKAGADDSQLVNYTYDNQGNFEAQLIVRGAAGNIVYQKNIPIAVVEPPNDGIKFSQQYAIGYATKLDPGFSVDITGFDPLEITWDFGKGTDFKDKDKKDKNPMYTYRNPGTYDGYVEMDTGDGKTMVQRYFQVIVLSYP